MAAHIGRRVRSVLTAQCTYTVLIVGLDVTPASRGGSENYLTFLTAFPFPDPRDCGARGNVVRGRRVRRDVPKLVTSQ